MGLTKQYLRFVRGPTFSVIGSNSEILHLKLNGIENRYVALGACENVLIWDLRKSEQVACLKGEKSAVTCLAISARNDFIASGYADGFVRIFDLSSFECAVVFNGHKSAVTTVSYSADGARLVTGSKDTEIVVWDVVNESGIVRLRGHKGPITKCRFMKRRNILVSSSKDTFVKFWDLDIQHCFFTLTGHRSEVWDFMLLKNDEILITGSNEQELHVWNLKYKEQQNENKNEDVTNEDEEENNNILSCSVYGVIPRQTQGRLVSLGIDNEEKFIACHGPGRMLEIFKLSNEEEITNTIRRRQKKERKKLAKNPEETALIEKDLSVVSVEDYMRKLNLIKASGKVKSFDLIIEENSSIRVFLLLHNNCVETYSISSTEKNSEPLNSNALTAPGHRTDIRAVSFSSDNVAILSGSGEAIKIWNRTSQKCIRTMESIQVTCLSFTPGDRHCIVGTKNGKLQLFDIASATLLQSEDAHDGVLWSLCLTPDQRGFITGSADKQVKFWEFELLNDSDSPGGKLRFQHVRTLQMPDDVLCVKLSPDNRLIAVGLLDSTVKVFFVDTLKFFLSLYGHKLPVLCMDISYDSTLLISGSADRNVKIWGLDFGDCHRSLFAHDDSITCIQFIPKTHLFFTGGKDGMINQWDADTFEKIIKLQGHQGEVWTLSVSPSGKFLATGSRDKSIRLWEQTHEPLVLEEEKEMEREEEYEKQISTGENNTVIPGEKSNEAQLAGRQTAETLKAAERLMEALDIFDEECEKLAEHRAECSARQKELPPPTLHPMLLALNASNPLRFIMEILKRIKSSEMEEALLLLSFDYLTRLIKVLGELLDRNWEIELVCRCLFFLFRVHHGQITTNMSLLSTVEKIRKTSQEKLSVVKDLVNFNLAGLSFVKQEIETKEQVVLFEDASKQVAEKRRKKRLKQDAVKRALMTL